MSPCTDGSCAVGPNVERLTKVVGQITLFPERHDQGRWLKSFRTVTVDEVRQGRSCGTAGCFAGWTTLMFSPSGSVYSPNVDSHILVPAPGGKYVLENGSAVNRAYADFYHPQTEGLAPRSVDDYAEELLGLSHSQANWLFASHRSVEELVAGVRFIILNPDATGTDLTFNCNL